MVVISAASRPGSKHVMDALRRATSPQAAEPVNLGPVPASFRIDSNY